MDQTAFWGLIDRIDRYALHNGDEQSAVQPLVDALATHAEADIRDFENILAQYLFDIDGQVYADHAGESGPSGDAFLYARCFVVANGKDDYHAVKADPARMPKSLDQWCEPLLYVAQRAWMAATGGDEESWDYHAPVSYETGSNKAKWA